MLVQGVGRLGDTTCSVNGIKKAIYHKWHDMLRRCFNKANPSYPDYGGRGITVCERWLTFANYEQDIKELEGYDDPTKTTIDRIDNDGPYSPDNCCWATRKQQTANRRPHSKRFYFVAYPPGFDGDGAGLISNNQSEFARQHGLRQNAISMCLSGERKHHLGWRFKSVEED